MRIEISYELQVLIIHINASICSPHSGSVISVHVVPNGALNFQDVAMHERGSRYFLSPAVGPCSAIKYNLCVSEYCRRYASVGFCGRGGPVGRDRSRQAQNCGVRKPSIHAHIVLLCDKRTFKLSKRGSKEGSVPGLGSQLSRVHPAVQWLDLLLQKQ